MNEEHLMMMIVAATLIVAERDNKTFLRLWAGILILVSIWKYGF